MPLFLNNKQREDLVLLRQCTPEEVINLCKAAFDYLIHGPNEQRLDKLVKRHKDECDNISVRRTVEALISLLIDATKANAQEDVAPQLLKETGLNEEVTDILAQFLTSKRSFLEGSIKTANIRAYRLVNLDWRLEVRVASRSVLRQCTVLVTMKLFLHTEPKNENRDLLGVEGGNKIIHSDEQRNRKDLLVQTDVSSLRYVIKSLEDALMESKTRRIRNIVAAIH